MDQPNELREKLEAACELADAELKKQGDSCAELKEMLRDVVDAVELDEQDEAKRLMTKALDHEYEWLLDCEIGGALSEFLGYDGDDDEEE